MITKNASPASPLVTIEVSGGPAAGDAEAGDLAQLPLGQPLEQRQVGEHDRPLLTHRSGCSACHCVLLDC